jgi:hypothetical protein
MRLHRHDLRDFKLAFGLAFDVTRVLYSGVALAWTAFVAFATLAAMAWRAGVLPFSPNAWITTSDQLAREPWTPLRVLLVTCVLTAWWIGFRWLTAPVSRSAAMDIARDERERTPFILPLCNQAALAPFVGLVIVALVFGAVLQWALVALIPGTIGAVIAGLLLPLVVVAAVFGAAVLLVLLGSLPMVGPVAVTEGRDHFEAFTRPVSYLMQRPGAYLVAWLVRSFTILASAVVGMVVLAVGWGLILAALWVVGLGETGWTAIKMATAQAIGDDSPLSYAIALGIWGSFGLFAAWLLAVVLSSNVILYLLMRYRVDGTPFDTITIAEDKLEQVKTPVETAAEAEDARKRGDAKAAKAPAGEPDAAPASAGADDAAKG